MDIMDAKRKIAQTAIERMFRSSGWVDICTIDKCCEMLRIVPPKDHHDMLQALHCVHWNEMDQETRDIVKMCVLDIFKQEPFDVSGIVSAMGRKPKLGSVDGKTDDGNRGNLYLASS